MFGGEKLIFEGDTSLGHYQVVDMVYEGRRGRVLFSGRRTAAFSGIPLDGQPEMLFDYIQRLFELVVHVRPRRLLIIGGGTYTLPMALLKELPDIQIDVVEIDPGLDDIAEAFFNYKPDPRLRIFHMDGKQFLEKSNEIYDLLILDAFSHLHIPDSLSDNKTMKLINERLTKNGLAAINIISPYFGRSADIILDFYKKFSNQFKFVTVFPADTTLSLWVSQNLVLIADKSKPKDNYGLRFGSLNPPLALN